MKTDGKENVANRGSIMKKYLSRRKKKKLLAALLAGLCLMTPWNRAEAMSVYETQNGLIQMYYLDACEGFIANGDFIESQSTLPDWQKERLNFAADYWDGLLKHTKTAKQPVILPVRVNQNSYGALTVTRSTKVEAGGQTVTVTRPNAILNQGAEFTAEDGPAGTIVIGTPTFPEEGPQDSYDTPLPQNNAYSLTPTIIHEKGLILQRDC